MTILDEDGYIVYTITDFRLGELVKVTDILHRDAYYADRLEIMRGVYKLLDISKTNLVATRNGYFYARIKNIVNSKEYILAFARLIPVSMDDYVEVQPSYSVQISKLDWDKALFPEHFKEVF